MIPLGLNKWINFVIFQLLGRDLESVMAIDHVLFFKSMFKTQDSS